MMQTTPDDRTQNILALTRGILRELEDTQEPSAAVNYCREIYRVAIQAFPGEELIRAMESRLPKPRTAPADDISLSTNGRKLVIARPIGELGDHIIYVTTAPGPVGVYFGAVRFSRGTTAADLIPEWDVEYPETRRKSQTAEEPQAQKPMRPVLLENGDCTTCANRTKKPDESGKFHCRINRPSTEDGRGKCADCAEVPAHRCAYKPAPPLTIRKRMTGEHWHKAVVAAANRGLVLPEEYYPYIAWVDAHKGLELAREQALHFAAMDRDGISYHEILTTQNPKETAARMYPEQADAIKRCIVSAAIVGIQAWTEKQNKREQKTNAPIGNNHEGQKACP